MHLRAVCRLMLHERGIRAWDQCCAATRNFSAARFQSSSYSLSRRSARILQASARHRLGSSGTVQLISMQLLVRCQTWSLCPVDIQRINFSRSSCEHRLWTSSNFCSACWTAISLWSFRFKHSSISRKEANSVTLPGIVAEATRHAERDPFVFSLFKTHPNFSRNCSRSFLFMISPRPLN